MSDLIMSPEVLKATAQAMVRADLDLICEPGLVLEIINQREAALALADEAQTKGEYLQQVPEMKLVGNAYVGMAGRIRIALGVIPHE